MGNVLIFVTKKTNCENVAKDLIEMGYEGKLNIKLILI